MTIPGGAASARPAGRSPAQSVKRPSTPPAQHDPQHDQQSDLFALCPRGLEAALATELAALGASDCRPTGGGVHFRGDRTVAYSANLHSRLASRVLRTVAQRRYRDDDDLYRLARSVDWERLLSADHTLRVDVRARHSPLRSLNFATLRIKDGIVDRLRDTTGARPSIDTRTPDVRVFAWLEARTAILYVDLSGEPLFKRGWRAGADDKGEAPLKENLAAGLLVLAGWTPQKALCDPFCGSGTIAIEAAQRVFGPAPGIARTFGFERLLDHDPALWRQLRDEAVRHGRETTQAVLALPDRPSITASDRDRRAIEQARRNMLRAGLPEQAIDWQVADATRVRAPGTKPGWIVTNPPYGQRIHARSDRSDRFGTSVESIDRQHEETMRRFGDALKQAFPGWRLAMLSSDARLPQSLGMREDRRTPLFNGAIECRLYGFDIRAAGRGTSAAES